MADRVNPGIDFSRRALLAASCPPLSYGVYVDWSQAAVVFYMGIRRFVRDEIEHDLVFKQRLQAANDHGKPLCRIECILHHLFSISLEA